MSTHGLGGVGEVGCSIVGCILESLNVHRMELSGWMMLMDAPSVNCGLVKVYPCIVCCVGAKEYVGFTGFYPCHG